MKAAVQRTAGQTAHYGLIVSPPTVGLRGLSLKVEGKESHDDLSV